MAAEHDQQVLVPRVLNRRERRLVQRPRQVDGADLGAERRRKRHDLYSHGISEAWITSGTPWPPTDLIARSTSFKPNRCVVTFSTGKRLDASCATATSQAL